MGTPDQTCVACITQCDLPLCTVKQVGRRAMRARTLAAGAVLVLALPLVVWAMPANAATDRLPNLRMAPLTDLHIVKTTDGHKLLKFSMTVVNVGTGAFEVLGTRPDSSSTSWTVSQRIYND